MFPINIISPTFLRLFLRKDPHITLCCLPNVPPKFAKEVVKKGEYLLPCVTPVTLHGVLAPHFSEENIVRPPPAPLPQKDTSTADTSSDDEALDGTTVSNRFAALL